MCILFHERLSNEWTSQGVCESRVHWSKVEDLSNRDHQEGMLIEPKEEDIK